MLKFVKGSILLCQQIAENLLVSENCVLLEKSVNIFLQVQQSYR